MKGTLLKRILVGSMAMGMVGVPLSVLASNTANQTVTYEVQAINEIAVSGNPDALSVSAAVAGQPPTVVSDNTTHYDYTSNQTRKITAVLNTIMPTNVTLKINLVAPTGGSGGTDVTLTASAADVVTAIPPVDEATMIITYKLSALSTAGVVTSAQKTVTLTIVTP